MTGKPEGQSPCEADSYIAEPGAQEHLPTGVSSGFRTGQAQEQQRGHPRDRDGFQEGSRHLVIAAVGGEKQRGEHERDLYQKDDSKEPSDSLVVHGVSCL